MLTPRVIELAATSCHQAGGTLPDRELRCTACGNRMFSSRAPSLLEAGFRCVRCFGEVDLVPGTQA